MHGRARDEVLVILPAGHVDWRLATTGVEHGDKSGAVEQLNVDESINNVLRWPMPLAYAEDGAPGPFFDEYSGKAA